MVLKTGKSGVCHKLQIMKFYFGRPVNIYRPLFDWFLRVLNCAGQCLQRNYLKTDQAFLFGIVNTVSAVRLSGVGCGLSDVMYGNRKFGLAVSPWVFSIVGFDA